MKKVMCIEWDWEWGWDRIGGLRTPDWCNLLRNDIMGRRSTLRRESHKEHHCQELLSINILETTAILLFFGIL